MQSLTEAIVSDKDEKARAQKLVKNLKQIAYPPTKSRLTDGEIG